MSVREEIEREAEVRQAALEAQLSKSDHMLADMKDMERAEGALEWECAIAALMDVISNIKHDIANMSAWIDGQCEDVLAQKADYDRDLRLGGE